MCGFLVKACPSVREIVSGQIADRESSRDFLDAKGSAPKLEVFIKRDEWTSEYLQGTLRHLLLPNPNPSPNISLWVFDFSSANV